MKMPTKTQQEQLESIRRGIADIEGGHYIPHAAMKTWLLSLNLDRPLPPKCACGEAHLDPSKIRARKGGV